MGDNFFVILVLYFFVVISKCSNHWTVTDDGLTIQAVPDSLYMMRQPHSLIQFLSQEQKLNEVAQSKRSFVENEEAIRTRENLDDPDLENKLRSSDLDCIRANKLTINKETFLVSYTLANPLDDLEYIANDILPIGELTSKGVPHCTVDLPFSMYAFEHLQSMQERRSLSISPEFALNKTFPSRFQLDDFGHYVTKALEKEPTNSHALSSAALYWRIRGSAVNAIECFRRALHFSFRENRANIMFGLGNVLHKAGHSGDAAILYQVVLAEVDDPLVHLALGDALTIMLNRTEAIQEFEIAHSRKPSLDAIYKASALRCDMKLIKEMELQHVNLEQTITLKTSQKARFERVRYLEESIRRNSADAEARLQASLIYDYFTYGSLPYVDCRGLEQSGRLMMHCYLRDSDWPRYRNVVEVRHQKMVKDALRHMNPQINQSFPWTVNDEDFGSAELLPFMEVLKPMYGVTMDEPIAKPLYPLKPDNYNNRLLKDYASDNWLNITPCDSNRWFISSMNNRNIPQLFMSPDNKGFRVGDLLGKYLGLSPLQQHPLPWNAPFCSSFLPSSHPIAALFKIKGIVHVSTLGRSDEFAENDLKQLLKRLAGTDGIVADIGQRIHTLMHYEIGPRWLAFNLAALYWRVTGAPGLAVECLYAALASNANRFADVALVQIAQLVIRFATSEEHLNDASMILNMAMMVDPNEPITHLLPSIVSHLQKKHRSALKYAWAAVTLDPQFKLAVDFLHYLKCHNETVKSFKKELVWPVCKLLVEETVYCMTFPVEGCYVAVGKKGRSESYICRLEDAKKDACCRSNYVMVFLLWPIGLNGIGTTNRPRRSSLRYTDLKESFADVVPLDYGGDETLRKIKEMSSPLLPTFPVSQTEVSYEKEKKKRFSYAESWEEEVAVDIVPFPQFPLSLSQITDRKQMLVYDAALPEVLPLPSRELVEIGLTYFPMSRVFDKSFCANVKTTLSMLREQATPTWVSVTAKGVNMEEFMDLSAPVPALAGYEPVCPELDAPSPLKTFDHLPAYHLRDQFIFYKPEIGLEKAFKSLGNERERIEHVAGRLMLAMKVSKLNAGGKDDQDGGVHWTLSTASTLYWRVKGDAVNAIKCLRHSLNNAPSEMTDVALVSMANIFHQAGLLHSALISGGAALTISPKLVAVHVTLADIYASMGDYQHALQFYYSTLSLQRNFGPAKDRIRTIYCHTGKIIEF